MGRAEAPDRDVEGHEAAFDRLFRAHYAGLCTFILHVVRSRDVAEELVQDIFLRIWDRPDHGASHDVTRAYLYVAARNAALTYLRRQHLHATWARTEMATAHLAPAADRALAYAELRAAVHEAIAALPPRCQLIFTMHRQQELSYAEIASRLGLSVKTVEAQVARALRGLRARLGSA